MSDDADRFGTAQESRNDAATGNGSVSGMPSAPRISEQQPLCAKGVFSTTEPDAPRGVGVVLP
jgi:hypothetical protein